MSFMSLLFLYLAFISGSKAANSYNPKSSSELISALDLAEPGDTITLLPIKYVGDFVLNSKPQAKGRGGSGITLTGTSTNLGSNTIINGNDVALDIQGGKWVVKMLTIKGASTGVKVSGDRNTLMSLVIDVKGDGIIVNGNRNSLNSITLSNGQQGTTLNGDNNDLRSISCNGQSNYSIKIESGKRNKIRSLSITGTGRDGLILGEGSCCGEIRSVSIQGRQGGVLQIKGNSYRLKGLSVEGSSNLLGCSNVISSSVFIKLFQTETCNNTLKKSISVQEILENPV